MSADMKPDMEPDANPNMDPGLSLLARRHFLRQTAMAGAASLVSGAWLMEGAAQAEPAVRVIEVTAQRFKFTPSEIPLKVGERVVLAVKALDFAHGFNLPSFGKRLDLIPGQVVRVELQPQTAGRFIFLCDNFCGDGHETMQGLFVVSA